jgi:beta-galactosidase
MSRRRLSIAALIASSLLSACTSMPSGGSHTPLVQAAGDTRQTLFNNGWLFAKDDPATAADPAFDDHAWRPLTLPHDWSIEGTFDPKWASSTAYLPAGIAWYRKHFTLPASDAGKTVILRFDGVYEDSTVYLNGIQVGGRPYGYSSFECDITGLLQTTGENVLAVCVDHHTFADTRWYTGSGIYRNVYLVATNPIHVKQDGTFITTPDVNENTATLDVETTLCDSTPVRTSLLRQTDIRLSTRIFDNLEHEVGTTDTALVVYSGGESHSLTQEITVAKPSLWSIDHPTLYTAVTEIHAKNGQLLDTYRTHFGIRTIHFDANTGFTLNGENMKIKGVCLHEDAGALGAAIPQQVWERRLRILKDAGVNAIRTSHNPPAPEFLDLCDRMGFLVMDEAFDEWTRGKKKWMDKWNGQKFSTDGYHTSFQQWADKDLQDMIRRDRNHPSIVMWSIGNEIDYPHDAYPLNSPELPPVASRLIADVKALDTTRPVTAADAAIASNLYYPQLDIVGYNYQEQRYPADHAKHPLQIIYGSENSTRLDAWLAVADNPYIFGQFLWTGIDYLGEARGWPIHGSAPGLLDVAGFPKPLYYFRKSLWASEPMVKIEPQMRGFGNRNGGGGNTRLVCYTNCDTVEFFQNEKSLGERSPSTTTRTVEVPSFTAGTPLEAIGKRGGKPVAKDTFTQEGPPAAIALKEYATTFGPGDGPNVAQVELTITDTAGTLSTTASNDVAIALTGNATLLGIESGDLTSTEDPRAGHRKALHGRLIAYIETHGPVTVTASTQGLPPASIQVGQ